MAEPKTKDSGLTVLLTPNQFMDKSWVGRVKRDTYSVENVIAAISEANPGISYAMMNHVVELLQQEILRQLKAGHSVDVLGLGVIYLAPKESIDGESPEPEDVKGFEPRFSASKLVREEVADLKAAVTKDTQIGPKISHVTCLADGNTEGRIKVGRNVRLTGNKLTVGGDGSGIFFVPEKDGGPDTSEEKWVKTDTSYLPKNSSKYVEFTAPANLTPDSKYWILLRTAITSGGNKRKAAVETYSAQITAVA